MRAPPRQMKALSNPALHPPVAMLPAVSRRHSVSGHQPDAARTDDDRAAGREPAQKLLDGGEAFVKTSLLNFATGDLGLRITKFGSKALFGGLSFGVKRLDRTPVLLFGFDELLMMKR